MKEIGGHTCCMLVAGEAPDDDLGGRSPCHRRSGSGSGSGREVIEYRGQSSTR
jgi:hypothetical protein